MRAFLLSLFVLASSAQAADLECLVKKYYPNHKATIDGVFDAKVTIYDLDGGHKGRVQIVGHNPAIDFTEVLTKEGKRWFVGENTLLDHAIEDLGLADKVYAYEMLTFGARSNMGAAAFMWLLSDRDGKALDNLVFVWGALGLGSCGKQALIPGRDIPGLN